MTTGPKTHLAVGHLETAIPTAVVTSQLSASTMRALPAHSVQVAHDDPHLPRQETLRRAAFAAQGLRAELAEPLALQQPHGSKARVS